MSMKHLVLAAGCAIAIITAIAGYGGTGGGTAPLAAGMVAGGHAAVTVTRTQAIATARCQFVDPISDWFVVALCPQSAFSAGRTITPLYLDPGYDESAQTVPLTSNSWLIFLDLVPTHRPDHPAKYIVVDGTTGAATAYDFMSPPVVDGEPIYQTMRAVDGCLRLPLLSTYLPRQQGVRRPAGEYPCTIIRRKAAGNEQACR